MRFELILVMARIALFGIRRESGLVTVLLAAAVSQEPTAAANRSIAIVVRSACLLAWQAKHLRF